jgi:hypothetical protein
MENIQQGSATKLRRTRRAAVGDRAARQGQGKLNRTVLSGAAFDPDGTSVCFDDAADLGER